MHRVSYTASTMNKGKAQRRLKVVKEGMIFHRTYEDLPTAEGIRISVQKPGRGGSFQDGTEQSQLSFRFRLVKMAHTPGKPTGKIRKGPRNREVQQNRNTMVNQQQRPLKRIRRCALKIELSHSGAKRNPREGE